MWEYNYTQNSNELCHAKYNEEVPGHKYVSRQRGKSGEWQYTYAKEKTDFPTRSEINKMSDEEISSKLKRKTLESSYYKQIQQEKENLKAEDVFEKEKKKVDEYKKLTDSGTRTLVEGMTLVQHEVKNAADAEKLQKAYQDAGAMTEEELRNSINRLNLERQYADLARSREAETGSDKANKLLNYAIEGIEILGAGLGIAISLKYLLKKG